MKNKVLATLLAVCLFAGLAVPAFASTTSSQQGDASKVTKIEFGKTSYDIKQDTEWNAEDHIRVYESNKKLVLDLQQISYRLEGNSTTFQIDRNLITAVENNGTATLVATDDQSGKVIGKTTLKAVPNPAKGFALSFKYASQSNNQIPVGTLARDFTFKISPISTGNGWTNANRDNVADAVIADINAAIETYGKMSAGDLDGASEAAQEAVYTVDLTNMTAGTIKSVFGYALKAGVKFDTDVATTAAALKTEMDKLDVFASSGGDFAVTVEDNAASPAVKAVVTITANVAGLDKNAFKHTTALSGTSINATLDKNVKVVDHGYDGYDNTVAFDGFDDDNNMKFTIPAGILKGLKTDPNARTNVETQAEMTDKAGNNPKTVTAKTTLSFVDAIEAKSIAGLSSKTIEVGETFNFKDTIKVGAAKANVVLGFGGYSEEYYNDAAEAPDYAIVNPDNGVVTGVAVGKNRITVRLDANGATTSCVVTVVEKGTKPSDDSGVTTTVLSNWTPKLAVGQTSNIVVKATDPVTYTSLATDIVTVDAAGKMTAVKEGTAKIKVQEEGKEAVYLTVTVGATTTKPEDKPTDVPQTAVVALVALF